jgi:hypothetical protein
MKHSAYRCDGNTLVCTCVQKCSSMRICWCTLSVGHSPILVNAMGACLEHIACGSLSTDIDFMGLAAHKHSPRAGTGPENVNIVCISRWQD